MPAARRSNNLRAPRLRAGLSRWPHGLLLPAVLVAALALPRPGGANSVSAGAGPGPAAADPGATLADSGAAVADSAPAVREIPVSIVTDGAFRNLPRWRQLARDAVVDGTVDLTESVGLVFVPTEELSWEPPRDALSMEQLLDAAFAEVGPRAGLVAVFIGHRPKQVGQWSELGYAYLGRPALILGVPRREEIPFASYLGKELTRTFRHELGHVFGVPHLGGRNVMTSDPDHRDWEFAQVALDILRANRDMDFAAGSPFAGCDLETLRDAYLFLDDRGECEPALLINLGVAFHRERRPEEAHTLFEAGLRRKRDSVAGRLGMAQTLLDLGDTLQTRELVDDLAGDEEMGGTALGVLGGLWVRLGEPESARHMLTEALAADSTRFSLWFHRGLAGYQLEDYGSARADFERALETEERPEGWFNLGLACDMLEDIEGLQRAFHRYLELVPEGPRAEDAKLFLSRRR